MGSSASEHQPRGFFRAHADFDATPRRDLIDDGDHAVVPGAQALAESRRHGPNRCRRDAALLQQLHALDRGIVLGDAGVIGDGALAAILSAPSENTRLEFAPLQNTSCGIFSLIAVLPGVAQILPFGVSSTMTGASSSPSGVGIGLPAGAIVSRAAAS